MEYLAVGARCLLGVVFLVSSVSKVAGAGGFGAFLDSVRGMRVLPHAITGPVAWIIVVAEFAVWILLAVPILTSHLAGFAIAAVLLTCFAAGVGLSIRRGAQEPCRCFGNSATPLGHRHVVRNVVLTAASLAGAGAALEGGRTELGGLLAAVFAGLLSGCLVAVLDDILDLFRPMHRPPEDREAGDTKERSHV